MSPSPLLHGSRTALVQRILAVALAIGLLGTSSGCSYVFTRGPTARVDTLAAPEPSASPPCSTSNAPPAIDLVLGSASFGVGMLGLAEAAMPSRSSGEFSSLSGINKSAAVPGAILALVGTVFLASAVTGLGRTAECRRLEHPSGTEPAVVKQAALSSTSASPELGAR